jgi:hypothetical protein
LTPAQTARPIFLAAILVLLAAVLAADRRPEAQEQTSTLRADPAGFSAYGAAEAAQALLSPAEGAILIEDRGPAAPGYHETHAAGPGTLTLSVDCVGDGNITLVVSAAARREVVRVSAHLRQRSRDRGDHPRRRSTVARSGFRPGWRGGPGRLRLSGHEYGRRTRQWQTVASVR